MEWVLLFALWAPVVGALILRAAMLDPERRRRALAGYVRAAVLLHALALPPMLASYDVALLVLAGFDVALLLIVLAVWRDERELEDVLAALRDPARADAGARAAGRWMRELASRRGSPGIRVDHAIACARGLEEAARPADAEAVLEMVPRSRLAPRDAARVSLALAFLALDRGDPTRARALVARVLGRAPRGAPEITTARAAWALLDAIEGLSRRALGGISRIPGALATDDTAATPPLDRALVALARAHVLADRGETAAAREILRGLDAAGLRHAERLAAACAGPASSLVHSLEHPLEAPYR